jgi:hypothetical protein
MKTLVRVLVLFAIVAATLTLAACTSDGYTGTSTVYVGVGYGGYGPGWGYGWSGGYYRPPPVIMGPPVGARPMPY